MVAAARTYNIETISQSTYGLTDPEALAMLRMDSLIYDTTINTVFCNPTANSGITYLANWACYNAVSVGGSEHFNESYYGISSDNSTYLFTFYDSYWNIMRTTYRGSGLTLTMTRNPFPRSAH